MAWDEQHKKVAIKVIGTVESNMDYGAINYNDPITVGIAQWFGTRAAGLLHSIRNTQQWQQKMNGSTLDINGLSRHTASDPWWNTFYLSRAYDVSLRECLKANSATQDALLVKDIEGYTATAAQYGLDHNGNTDAFILWACAYHQSPRQALRVLMRGGGGMGLRAMYAAILADDVLGQYKTRYEKAYAIISSGDTSGVGSGGGATGAGVGNGTTLNANGNQEITIEGGELVVQTDNSNVMFAQTKFGNVNLYPCGINAWKANLNDIKTIVNVAVEQAAAQSGGGGGGGAGAGDGSAGAKALAWMKSRIMKFKYRQAPGRLNPDQSGFGDCSSTIYRAYMDTSGINPGTWTGDMYFRGAAVIERGRGTMSAAQQALLKPGDVIVISWGGGYPHTDHVEMYVGPGQTIGHGGDGPGPHINSIGMLSGAAWWTVRRHG